MASIRTVELMDAIRSKIANRALGPDDKLPSIRNFATTMSASPSTVVEAYDRLAAEGIIRAKPGSGFYVVGSNIPPLPIGEIGPRRDRAVDPFWVSRQSLDADGTMEKPGCGWLPADWMPNGVLRRRIRNLARADETILAGYGSSHGSMPLRRILLGRFAEEGLEAGIEQLLLTGSGTHAIDLVCRFLLHPGDTVLVDDPGYFNFQALLRAHRVHIVGIPYTTSGPDTAAFEAAVAVHKPRLYITNSALQNPTGASMSPQTAHRILRTAAAQKFLIVEDDIFADFEPTPSPRLAALDGLDRVIRIGSFSKTLSASVRCGYIAARADWIEGLIDLQVATSFGGPSPVATELIVDVLAGGSYRKHMADLRRKLARARVRTTERLSRLGIVPWMMPRGGFYLWCRLPDGSDSAEIAHCALDAGVILAPGNVFSVSQTATDFMRFNVAHSDTDQVESALELALSRQLRQPLR